MLVDVGLEKREKRRLQVMFDVLIDDEDDAVDPSTRFANGFTVYLASSTRPVLGSIIGAFSQCSRLCMALALDSIAGPKQLPRSAAPGRKARTPSAPECRGRIVSRRRG